MKAKCDDHGCSELFCGCPVEILENKADFSEIIRAKNKYIEELLNKVEELKTPSDFGEDLL